MKYCSECGGALHEAIPEGDDRPRMVCAACGVVAYVNPRTVVGCIVEHERQLLLCRRAIEPRTGFWTMPAGFLELGESTAEGARRETREEACAEVTIVAPHALLDIPDIGQSYVLFHARLQGSAFAAGSESEAVELVPYADVPWDELAFPVLYFALRLFVDDAASGRHAVHHGVVRWNGGGSRFDRRECELREHLRVELGEVP